MTGAQTALPRLADIRAHAEQFGVDISDLDTGGGRRSKAAMQEMLARIEAARAKAGTIDTATADAQKATDDGDEADARADSPADDGNRLIPLADLKLDDGVQSRAATNMDVVAEYESLMRDGVAFPPVVVFDDGDALWVGDGFHRVEAARLGGLEHVRAIVRSGSRRDAVLHAVGANAAHGLRRTNADKHRAVEILLADPEWSGWSDREVARRAGVSAPFVGKVRSSVSGLQMQTTKTVKRGNATYQMDTTGISTKGVPRGASSSAAGGPCEPDSERASAGRKPRKARVKKAERSSPTSRPTAVPRGHMDAEPVGDEVSVTAGDDSMPATNGGGVEALVEHEDAVAVDDDQHNGMEIDFDEAWAVVVDAVSEKEQAADLARQLVNGVDLECWVSGSAPQDAVPELARLLEDAVEQFAAADPEVANDWFRSFALDLGAVIDRYHAENDAGGYED